MHSPLTSNSRSRVAKPWRPALLIVAAVLAVFGRVVFHDFAGLDDSMGLYWNKHMGQPLGDNVAWYWSHPYMHLYTPVIFAVWNVIAVLGGKAGPGYAPYALNPQAFHAASLVVHAFNALLVYGLLRRLVKRDVAAALGTLLFALHPVQVEAVAWASGLKDLLCATFSLLTLTTYLRENSKSESRKPNEIPRPNAQTGPFRFSDFGFSLLSAAALLLALLCKPSAVMLPVLAATLDLVLLRTPTRRVARRVLPLLLVAGVMAVVGRAVQPGGQRPLIGLAWRPLVAADSLAFYLGKLALPWDFAVTYGRNPAAAHAAGALAWTWLIPATVAALVFVLRKHRWLVASALLLALAPLPVLGWLRFDYQRISTVADHYLYFAMLGPALFAAGVAARVRSRRLLATFALVLLALAIDSSLELREWRTNLAVWQHAVAVAPQCPEAHENLAAAYTDLGPAYAADQVRECQMAVTLRPDNVHDRDLLTGALLTAGRTDDAIAQMLATLALQERADRPGVMLPNDRLAAYLSIGDLLLAKNRPDAAADLYRRILRQLPNDPTARRHLELCIFRLPKEKSAAPIYLGAAE